MGCYAPILGELSERPKEHDWKSCRRANPVSRVRIPYSPLVSKFLSYGPLVKRLRHRPFTAVTRVRVPYGSLIKYPGGLAQLGEHLPYKQRVSGSIPLTSIRFRGVGVNMPACHAGDRGFKSRRDRILFNYFDNLILSYGAVAQLVEQRIEAPCVGSSILSRATMEE